mmetsp:Transcript_5116/g.6776  ORF Transcript_5116/g.6776 Transcript_5116/m.6776 type:complete len:148 (+) Transcript_5116:1252-1695(+)
MSNAVLAFENFVPAVAEKTLAAVVVVVLKPAVVVGSSSFAPFGVVGIVVAAANVGCETAVAAVAAAEDAVFAVATVEGFVAVRIVLELVVVTALLRVDLGTFDSAQHVVRHCFAVVRIFLEYYQAIKHPHLAKQYLDSVVGIQNSCY